MIHNFFQKLSNKSLNNLYRSADYGEEGDYGEEAGAEEESKDPES
jgi:hypothetical protein